LSTLSSVTGDVQAIQLRAGAVIAGGSRAIRLHTMATVTAILNPSSLVAESSIARAVVALILCTVASRAGSGVHHALSAASLPTEELLPTACTARASRIGCSRAIPAALTVTAIVVGSRIRCGSVATSTVGVVTAGIVGGWLRCWRVCPATVVCATVVRRRCCTWASGGGTASTVTPISGH
jgi:hypothetical protein